MIQLNNYSKLNIKWLSDIELQYELPSGEKKIYKLEEN